MIESATPRLPGTGGNRVALLLPILMLGLALVGGLGRIPGLGPRISPQMLFGAAVAVVLTGTVLRRIEYGVILLPVLAAAVPYSIGTGTQTTLAAGFLFSGLLVTVWVAQMLIHHRVAMIGSPANLPLLGFVLAAIIATLNSNAMRAPLVWFPETFTLIQLGGLSVFLLSAGVFWLTMNALREMRWVKWMVGLYLAFGAVVIAGYVALGGRDLPGISIGGLFSLWIMALAFGQAAFNNSLSRWQRVALLVLAFAWLGRRFFAENDWLSGWIPAVVALLVVSALRSWRVFSVALLIVGAVAVVDFDAIYQQQVVGDAAAGNVLRVELWEQNLIVTRDNLLLGTGPAGYAPYYMSYFPDRAWSTHSNYLDVFAQTGLLGSFFFLWFLLAAFKVGFGARNRWKSGFAAGFVNGSIGALFGMVVAMAFGDWVIPFVYNQTLSGFRYSVQNWVFLGALAGLHRIASNGRNASEPHAGG